jgi:hypothetical protein
LPIRRLQVRVLPGVVSVYQCRSVANKCPVRSCRNSAFLLILSPAGASHTCCKTQKLRRVLLRSYLILPPRTVTVRRHMSWRPDLIWLNAQVKTIFTQRDGDIWKYDKRTSKDKNGSVATPGIFAPFAVRVNQLAIEYGKLQSPTVRVIAFLV